MRQTMFILFMMLFLSVNSQKRISADKRSESQMIILNYSLQMPLSELSTIFGYNSSLGIAYLNNKNSFLYGVDANFMFGNKIKNDSLLDMISTQDGYLINASGELDQVLLFERGFNTHLLFGKAFMPKDNDKTGIYCYLGVGYLQHKIRIESDRTNLPQINSEYIKGYDNFTSGISSKICLDYMYFDKKTLLEFYVGFEFINALTKNRRAYSFGEMIYNDRDINIDQLLGARIGVIITINRNNEGDFHYR